MAADGLEDLGDAADDAARDAKNLDRELADVERQINDVVRALSQDPGDIGLRKQLRALQRESRTLSGIRKQFEGLGDDSAKGFALAFQHRVGPLIARLPISGTMTTVLGGATAAAAPVVSSLVASAISGGAALGAVGIGTALAAQRPEVQKAGAALGQSLMSALVSDAEPMVKPVLAGIATIEKRFLGMRGSIRNIFDDAGGFVAPLVEGVADAANELVGSFEKVVDGAGPAVEVIGNHLPKVAAAAGDALEAMGSGGARSAAMLATAMTAVEGTLRLTAGTMFTLNKLTPFLFGHLMLVNDALDGSSDASEDATFDMNAFLASLNQTSSAAATTTGKIRTLDDAFDEFTAGATDAFNAETKFGQALADITNKANRNSAGLDTNTAKGRANREALAALARQTRESAAAVGAMSGGQQRANGMMDRGYAAFIKAARGMGIAEHEARQLAAALGLIRSKTVTIKTVFTSVGARKSGGSTPTGGTQVKGYSVGGVVEGPGPRGIDSVPALLAPGEGVLTTKGLQAIGGARALDALNKGRAVTPTGSAVLPGRGGPVQVVVSAGGGMEGDLGKALLRLLRFTVVTNGGSGSVLGITR